MTALVYVGAFGQLCSAVSFQPLVKDKSVLMYNIYYDNGSESHCKDSKVSDCVRGLASKHCLKNISFFISIPVEPPLVVLIKCLLF